VSALVALRALATLTADRLCRKALSPPPLIPSGVTRCVSSIWAKPGVAWQEAGVPLGRCRRSGARLSLSSPCRATMPAWRPAFLASRRGPT